MAAGAWRSSPAIWASARDSSAARSGKSTASRRSSWPRPGGWLKVEPIAGRNALAVELATSLTPVLPEVLARLKNLFDLGARPDIIASHLRSDPRIAGLVDRHPGLRVPGAFDGFELTVRAI